jgi:hypothetical protein
MSEAEGAAGPVGARQRSYWLLLAGGGLLLGGAVALYAWTNTWVGPVRGVAHVRLQAPAHKVTLLTGRRPASSGEMMVTPLARNR